MIKFGASYATQLGIPLRSIPILASPHRKNLRDETGYTYAIEVGDYFRGREGEVEEWLLHAAPPEVKEGLAPFRTPVFMRTLSSWLNKLVEADFVLEHFGEPCPSNEVVQERPGLQDAQIVAYFLHVRTRKPAGITG